MGYIDHVLISLFTIIYIYSIVPSKSDLSHIQGNLSGLLPKFVRSHAKWRMFTPHLVLYSYAPQTEAFLPEERQVSHGSRYRWDTRGPESQWFARPLTRIINQCTTAEKNRLSNLLHYRQALQKVPGTQLVCENSPSSRLEMSALVEYIQQK